MYIEIYRSIPLNSHAMEITPSLTFEILSVIL